MFSRKATPGAVREEPRRGAQAASVLAGAWRVTPPPLDLSAEALAEVVPLLLEGGAGALGWRRVCQSSLAQSRVARPLREAYRRQVLEAAIMEGQFRELAQRFQAAGVEPILIKGWAVARLYPEPGLRPFDDFDLCVPPEQLAAVKNVLDQAAGQCGWVDLHRGVPEVPDRTWDELWQRSQRVSLGEVEVRLLAAEDHLRLLCLHLWRHHAYRFYRPLWLCDIGAFLETLPAGFDWDYCLHGDRVTVDWVRCVLGLAGRLLGARLEHPAVAERIRTLPPWLVNTVLWGWGASPHQWSLAGGSRLAQLTRLGLHHCLNPIKACYRLRLRPRRSLLGTRLLVWLGLPVEMLTRLRRRLLQQRPPADQPFDLHPSRPPEFL
jgi:hypothetical protein